jgi:Ca-activated chloride channel family protein
MDQPNKLPLLKSSMRMLVESLGEKDRVAIVVYAAAEGLVLPSTSCYRKGEVLSALDQLQAGGSTNGGAGIKLAYAIASDPRNFIKDKDAINRVILCTDGDFNVGTTSDGELNRLIEEKRKSNVFLSVLGFGEGNLQEAKLKGLATHGNGNYHYIDTLAQARKVLIEEGGSTLVTIAKDVKIQVEFNPAKVSAFRQIGYELRQMAHADFNNDAKDAGEIGAGHSVTALYELVPVGKDDKLDLAKGNDLLFQKQRVLTEGDISKNALMVRIKYKRPTEDKSQPEIQRGAEDTGRDYAASSGDFKFSAAVASFGLVLRDSKYKGNATFASVEELAKASIGSNPNAYRNELIELIHKAQAVGKP